MTGNKNVLDYTAEIIPVGLAISVIQLSLDNEKTLDCDPHSEFKNMALEYFDDTTSYNTKNTQKLKTLHDVKL